MRLRTVIAVPVLMSAALALAAAQERVKPKGPATFAKAHEELAKAWAEERYGRCMSLTRDLLGLISAKRAEAIRAALPGAPKGFEVVAQPKDEEAENPLVAAMAAGAGTAVEQRYTEAGGGTGEIHVTVTADSPLGALFSMWVANPALAGEGAESIKYGDIDALLKQEGEAWALQVLIDESMVEARVRGRDDEFLLQFFNQSAVDRVAATLRK